MHDVSEGGRRIPVWETAQRHLHEVVPPGGQIDPDPQRSSPTSAAECAANLGVVVQRTAHDDHATGVRSLLERAKVVEVHRDLGVLLEVGTYASAVGCTQRMRQDFDVADDPSFERPHQPRQMNERVLAGIQAASEACADLG